MNNRNEIDIPSKLPHRLAVLLVCVTFPLLFVGGLVTTKQAGMAVPDWPNTYGYNLLLYPLTSWIGGPLDLLLEHSHRLLGALAGFLTIGLVIVLKYKDRRPSMFWWGIGGLVLVLVQGGLGGIRVLFDDRDFAKIHGCTGPLFFAYSTMLAVWTSSYWQETRSQQLQSGVKNSETHSKGSTELRKRTQRFWYLAIGFLLFAYTQLVLGAFLRHLVVTTNPHLYFWLAVCHITLAFLLLFASIVLMVFGKPFKANRRIKRVTSRIHLLVTLQVLLGIGTWALKNGLPPGWAETFSWTSDWLILHETGFQTVVITSHVAMGSLILALSVMLVLRSYLYLVQNDKMAENKNAI
ncbi:MAG: COX15/CtaA family protein [Pirellulaceae bacterium]|nr:COX15/CtaA family protein [Pirellulaceae bacterium]